MRCLWVRKIVPTGRARSRNRYLQFMPKIKDGEDRNDTDYVPHANAPHKESFPGKFALM